MTNLYDGLHKLFNEENRFHFPYKQDIKSIPKNGIYILFEKGESYKEWDRIVRVGTHNGDKQLRSRLNQHFIKENKDRSIFRKNIGRCFLSKDNNPYLKIWNFDTTSTEGKEKYGDLINKELDEELEKKISVYIQNNLSFIVFEILQKADRLFWESRITSTLAAFPKIKPSDSWLGNSSPKEKILKYGLWQVNELLNQPLNLDEFKDLVRIIKSTKES